MEETESVVQDGVEGVLSRATGLERSVGSGDVLDGLLRVWERKNVSAREDTRGEEAGRTNDVDIADLVEPEAVDIVGGLHEVAVAKVGVNIGGGGVELLEDPLLDERLVAGGLWSSVESANMRGERKEVRTYLLRGEGNVVGVELGDGEFGGVPEFVAELW